MPRLARVQISGIPSHVVQCGADRQAVFFDEVDYEAYLSALEECDLEKHNIKWAAG